MGYSDFILYAVARNWPSPVARKIEKLGAEPDTVEYGIAYAQEQFNSRVRNGINEDVVGLDVLEIGCGHGGISCFMAVVGARNVVGIDIDLDRLRFAKTFLERLRKTRFERHPLPISFVKGDAENLSFPDCSFDLVKADNAFEHFRSPDAVMREVYRVLRPGGMLLVNPFSSIFSKYGLHLKHGLKVPWTNLVFSEKTIVKAMLRLAETDPKIKEIYPGISRNPSRVRDLRRYGDLNSLTYREFKSMARKCGFEIKGFRLNATPLGKIIGRFLFLKNTFLMDIFSYDATASLLKRK